MKSIKLSISLAIMAVLAAHTPWTTARDAAASEPQSAPVPSGPLRFEERLIMKDYAYPFGIAAADLDGDGDLDLSSADLDGDGRPDIAAVAERGSCEFRWWRNLGPGNK